MRECPRCQTLKSLHEFYSRKGRPSCWCKVCLKEDSRNYYAAHHRLIKDQTAAYKAENKDEIDYKNWVYNNKIKRRKNLWQSLQHNKESYLFALDSLDQEELCFYCNIRPCELMDHVLPKCRGGTSDLSNIVPCCFRCNSEKNHKTGPEYFDMKVRNKRFELRYRNEYQT